MKTRLISSLIVLLFLFSALGNAREAELRIIGSRITLMNDSVHVCLTLQASGLASNYHMDLTPVIYIGTKEVLLPGVRIAGSRNRRSQERKKLFGRDTSKGVFLTVSASDTLFYEAALPYQPWMGHALLRIDNRLSGCCCSVLLPPTLAAADLALTLSGAEKQEITESVVSRELAIVLSPIEQLSQREGFIRRDEMYEADKQTPNYYRAPDALRIFFRQGDITIDTTYVDNASTLRRLDEALRAMTADSTVRITRLVVVGYASIEGTLQCNTYIAGKRAEILREYATARGVPVQSIETVNMSEGWDELRDMVATSRSVPYREEILHIIDTVPVLKGREKQLMNLHRGAPYRWMMENFFPRQRNAGYVKIYFGNY